MKRIDKFAELLMLALLFGGSAACASTSGASSDSGNSGSRDAAGRDASGRDAAPPDSAPSCDPRGPCEVVPDCDPSLWHNSPLPSHSWWLDMSPTSCADHVQHGSSDAPVALDDCGPISREFMPYSCGILRAGAAVCGSGQYWTQTCHVSADCPDGMGCVASNDGPIHDSDAIEFGSCEQRCGSAGDPVCVRCGYVCAPEGYCKPEPPPLGHACTADCECMEGEICNEGGHCWESPRWPDALCGLPDSAYPYPELRCACSSGTCETNARTGRNCCRSMDGSIASYGAGVACK